MLPKILPIKFVPKLIRYFFALLIVALTFSCMSNSNSDSTSIKFQLNDSLKNYSRIVITIVDAKNPNTVLDTVYNGKLPDPKALPAYTVPARVGTDFQIKIKGYNAKNELALESDIAVKGGSATPPQKVAPDKLPGLNAKGKLLSLDVSSGILVPAFDTGVTVYTITLPFQTDSILVNATSADTFGTLTLNGALMKSGVSSKSNAVIVGETKFVFNVTAKGSLTASTYTLTVIRKPGTEARLDSLKISSGKLSPAFNSDVFLYHDTVAAEVENLNILAFAKERKAKLEIAGGSVDSTGAITMPLIAGDSTLLTIKVTSLDSTTSKIYSLMVKRLPSSDASLMNVSLSSGSLVPTFDPDLDKYTATLASDSVYFVVTPKQAQSKISFTGVPIKDSVTFGPIKLDVGLTPFVIAVIAPDGKTKKSYSFTLNRANPDAYLLSLGIQSVVLDSTFLQNRIHYKASVLRSVDKVTLVCQGVLNAKGLVGSVNGDKLVGRDTTNANGKSTAFTVPLKVGENTIAIEVTAQDGVGKNTYSITLVRTPNIVCDLSAFALAPSPFKPGFIPDSLNYTDTVGFDVSTVTANLIPKDTASRIIVRVLRLLAVQSVPILNATPLLKSAGTTNSNLLISPVPLLRWQTVSADTLLPHTSAVTVKIDPGNSLLDVDVLAENQTISKTYVVKVYRAFSNISQLSNLIISASAPVNLAPVFASATSAYSGTTIYSFANVLPTAIEPSSKIYVNGIIVANGTISPPIALAVGPNVITVVSTAPDGKTASTYSIILNRLNLGLIALP